MDDQSTLDKAVERSRVRIPRQLRRLRGKLSQRAFARKIDVFQQNQNRYETGAQGPAFDYLARLCHMGVDLNALVLGRGPLMRDGRATFDA